MLESDKTLGANVTNGRLILAFLGNDQNRYDISLSAGAAAQMLAVVLQAAEFLPRAQSDEMPVIRGQVGIALAIGTNIDPALRLQFGQLSLALPLQESQLASLCADMTSYLDSMKRRQ